MLTHQHTFLDIALILALIGFLGTVAYSFYIQKRKNK
ncbi:monovalent cation/H+ antiporter complex subunit F [Longispora fulva]